MRTNLRHTLTLGLVAVCGGALAVGAAVVPGRMRLTSDVTRYAQGLPIVARLELEALPEQGVRIEGTDLRLRCSSLAPDRAEGTPRVCHLTGRPGGTSAATFDLGAYITTAVIRRDAARGLVVVTTDFYSSEPVAAVRDADGASVALGEVLGTLRSTLPFRASAVVGLGLVLAALPRRRRLARGLDTASLRFGQIDARGVLHLDDGASIQLPVSQQYLGQRVVVHHAPPPEAHYREDPTQPREDVRLDPADWYLQSPRNDLDHHDLIALTVLATAAAAPWLFILP